MLWKWRPSSVATVRCVLAGCHRRRRRQQRSSECRYDAPYTGNGVSPCSERFLFQLSEGEALGSLEAFLSIVSKLDISPLSIDHYSQILTAFCRASNLLAAERELIYFISLFDG